jgi:hypothetical protein
MTSIIARVLISERFLPDELCIIIGSYVRVSNSDKIKFLFANQDEPDVLVYDSSVVEDLDEIIHISYGLRDDAWSRMTLLDRVDSNLTRSFNIYLNLPNLGRKQTVYTQHDLIRDMQVKKSTNFESFKWRDVFSLDDSYGRFGIKIRMLWDDKYMASFASNASVRVVNDPYTINMLSKNDEAFFNRMRKSLGISAQGIVIPP